MIEISKPEGALKHKGCDSCGDHENVIVIRISSNEGTCFNTVCLCRDCAKLLSVALEEAVERLYGDTEKHAREIEFAKAILKEHPDNMEAHNHVE